MQIKEALNDLTYDPSKVDAYLTVDGELISPKEVEDIFKSNGNESSNLLETDEDEWGEQYASGRVYAPRLPLENLKVYSIDELSKIYGCFCKEILDRKTYRIGLVSRTFSGMSCEYGRFQDRCSDGSTGDRIVECC